MQEKKRNKLTQIEIILAVSVVLVLVLSFFPDLSITGHAFMNPYSQELDMVITESQSYVLTSDKINPFQLISFRLSGNVAGEGQVEITLESAAGQELLVYSNVKERSKGLEEKQ